MDTLTKRQSQTEEILDLFLSRADVDGGWISALTLCKYSLSYTRRIFEIRQMGYSVDMRDEQIDGQRRTAYRIQPATPEERKERVAAMRTARNGMFKRRCDWCKRRFEAVREDAEVCSDSCRAARWKAKHSERAAADGSTSSARM